MQAAKEGAILGGGNAARSGEFRVTNFLALQQAGTME